jgi:hypothetical protein
MTRSDEPAAPESMLGSEVGMPRSDEEEEDGRRRRSKKKRRWDGYAERSQGRDERRGKRDGSGQRGRRWSKRSR